MKPAENSEVSAADIETYLTAKVEGFAGPSHDDGMYPEKLGWLLGVVSGLLSGRETLDELREEIRKAVAQ